MRTKITGEGRQKDNDQKKIQAAPCAVTLLNKMTGY
jgi:hypothetical protein